jgi:hypothetical protein
MDLPRFSEYPPTTVLRMEERAAQSNRAVDEQIVRVWIDRPAQRAAGIPVDESPVRTLRVHKDAAIVVQDRTLEVIEFGKPTLSIAFVLRAEIATAV